MVRTLSRGLIRSPGTSLVTSTAPSFYVLSEVSFKLTHVDRSNRPEGMPKVEFLFVDVHTPEVQGRSK